MKKFLLLFLITFFSLLLIACGKTDDEHSSGVESMTPEIPAYPHLKPEKDVFKLGEDIPVKLFNTEGCKKVVLTEYGREPTSLHDVTLKSITSNPTEISLNGSRVEKAGDYTIWLCGSSAYDYIYTYDIHIDDEDTNDYKISNAQLVTDSIYNTNEGRVIDVSYVEINTDYTKKLTYRLYWCNDGKRLADYMALKTVISSNTNNIIVNLPNNIYKPKEANQIEIAVVEGVSTSYYLDVNGKLELENSEYEFTFNAISDLHIQSPQDSLLFNNHLKTALKNIYSTNSKAILAVGDIVNNGKESEYEFFYQLYNEVENKNNIGFYPAVGNHEYMYFTDFNEPLNYFKKHHNLQSHYYSFELEGYKFIVLGTDTISRYGFMYESQLKWLENELEEVEEGKPVFIAVHQGLQNTVDGTLFTLYGQTDYGFIENNSRIVSILNKHPNAILFTGHSHAELEGDIPVSINTTGAIYATCGSMSYLNMFNKTEWEGEIGGFEGLFIEVYADYILIRGKEFGYNKWVANCQIKIPRNYVKFNG